MDKRNPNKSLQASLSSQQLRSKKRPANKQTSPLRSKQRTISAGKGLGDSITREDRASKTGAQKSLRDIYLEESLRATRKSSVKRKGHTTSGKNQVLTTEEKYERKKQEELRKQIEAKEHQLEELSKQAERMKMGKAYAVDPYQMEPPTRQLPSGSGSESEIRAQLDHLNGLAQQHAEAKTKSRTRKFMNIRKQKTAGAASSGRRELSGTFRYRESSRESGAALRVRNTSNPKSKEPMLQTLRDPSNGSKRSKRGSSKSPAVGGGLRSQPVPFHKIEPVIRNERGDDHELPDRSSPLRLKQPSGYADPVLDSKYHLTSSISNPKGHTISSYGLTNTKENLYFQTMDEPIGERPAQHSPLRQKSRSPPRDYRGSSREPTITYNDASFMNDIPQREAQQRMESAGRSRSNSRESRPRRTTRSRGTHRSTRNYGQALRDPTYNPAQEIPTITSRDSNRLIKPVPITQGPGTISSPRQRQTLTHNPSIMSIEKKNDVYKKDIEMFSHTAHLEEKLLDRLDSLKLDNESLQKRMNLAVIELERVKKDKEQIELKITKQVVEIERLQSAINSKDSVDQQNLNFEEEIVHQKEANKGVRTEINVEQNLISEVEKQLRDANVESQNSNLQGQHLNEDISRIMEQIDSILQAKIDVQKQINITNEQLTLISQEELHLSQGNIDYETEVQHLQIQRTQQLKDLQAQTFDYDDCVRNMTRDNYNQLMANKHLQQRITSKIIFKSLEAYQANLKVSAFKEFQNYSRFDLRANRILRAYSLVLHRLAKRKIEASLKTWYDATLRPIQTNFKNEELADKTWQLKVKGWVFHAWFQFHQDRLSLYTSKTNSIALIWSRLNLAAETEVKRGITIWKEKVRFQNKRGAALRRIMASKNKNLLMAFLFRWQVFSREIEQACRLEVAKRDFAHVLYKTSIYYKIKQQSFLDQSKRMRLQWKVFNAMKKYMQYKDLMFKQHLQVIKFQQINQKFTLQDVFNALKANKEDQKAEIMKTALSEDMDVALERAKNDNTELTSLFRRQNEMRAGHIVMVAFGKKLFSYFQRWKADSQQFGSHVTSKLKDMIYLHYKERMLSYFLHWRKNSTQKKLRKKKMVVAQVQQQGLSLEREAIEDKTRLGDKREGVRSLAQKKTTKVFKKYLQRRFQLVWLRWTEFVHGFNTAHNQQNLVLSRYRLRLLKEAFSIYKAFSLREQQRATNRTSAECLRQTLEVRTLRKVFNAHCAYVHTHKAAKRKLRKALWKIDLWQLEKTMKTWRENGNSKRVQQLEATQLETVEMIEVRNKTIGQFESRSQNQVKDRSDFAKEMKRKGRRQLGNYMKRLYNKNTSEKFLQWKEMLVLAKHRESLLLRTTQHWQNLQLLAGFRAFVNHRSRDVKADRTTKIKHLKVLQEEQSQSIVHNQDVANSTRQRALAVRASTVKKSSKKQTRLTKAVEILTEKNHTLDFASKKRMIFTRWATVAKQERALVLCIKNVALKSWLTRGFTQIKGTYRELKREDKMYRHLNMMLLRFKKLNQADAVSKWKAAALSHVDRHFTTVRYDHGSTGEDFSDRIVRIKDQNCKRGFAYFHEKRLANVFLAWKNTKAFLKLKRTKEREVQELFAATRQKRALQKWRLRVESTKRIRNNVKVMRANQAFRLKQAISEALRVRHDIRFGLVKTISNLEKMMRDKAYIEAFRTIQSFATSKNLATNSYKQKSARGVMSILVQTHEKRLRRYFGIYRFKVKVKQTRGIHVSKIMKKIDNMNLRDGFRQWMLYTDKVRFAEELNQTGPITEQVFEANRTIKNLKSFMRKENYTEEEVTAKFKEVCDYNTHLMDKTVKRLKLNNPEGNLMPKAFDNWKMWIKEKRLMNYYLRLANNSVEHVKCDMRRAFEKWRRGDIEMANHLDTQDFLGLADRNRQQGQDLEGMAEREAEASQMIGHLNLQRDELLDHYVRSQKLALSLLRENHRKGMRQAFSRWKEFKKVATKGDGEVQVYEAIQEIAVVKTRMVQLERENATLAQENEDLRKFSVDGFQIAKNVQQLSKERDSLSMDLADRMEKILMLTERNKQLRDQLAELGQGVSDDEGGGDENQPVNHQVMNQANQANQVPAEQSYGGRFERMDRFANLPKLK